MINNLLGVGHVLRCQMSFPSLQISIRDALLSLASTTMDPGSTLSKATKLKGLELLLENTRKESALCHTLIMLRTLLKFVSFSSHMRESITAQVKRKE